MEQRKISRVNDSKKIVKGGLERYLAKGYKFVSVLPSEGMLIERK